MTDIPSTALPPQDLDAERALLASVFLANDFFPEAAPIIAPQMFYLEAHQQIWTAIADLIASGTPADSITLPAELTRRGQYAAVGGEPYLVQITDCVTPGAYAGHYAKIVREKWQRRQTIYALTDCQRAAYTAPEWPEPLHKIDAKLQTLLSNTTDAATVDVADLMTDTIAKLSRPKQPGIATGIAGLDRLTNGLQTGQLIVIAARPGVGKSALALTIARHTARETGTLFVSLEMSTHELAQRLLTAETGIPLKWLPRAVTDEAQAENIHDALQRIGQLREKLHLADTASMTTRDIAAIARLTQRKHGLGLLLVDYLQLITATDPKQIREQQVATMTRELKLLAKSLGVPVVLLSQLNRQVENRDNKQPRLSDLRESGAIEQDADVVLLPWCPEPSQPAIVELIVAKHRNGPLASLPLAWDSATMTFSEPAPPPCEWDLPDIAP